MKVTKKYILFCEDVRIEDNGKLMILGLFGDRIYPVKLPLAIPLSIVTSLAVDGNGDIRINGTFRHVDSDSKMLTFNAKGLVGDEDSILIPFKFNRVKFEKPGLYEVLFKVEGQEEVLSESFRVIEGAKVQAISTNQT